MQSQYPKIDIVIQIQASCCLAVAPVDDQGMMPLAKNSIVNYRKNTIVLSLKYTIVKLL